MKRKIKHILLNIPGWHTKRKIVVFESDDWGSIRMPSRNIYELLLKKGIAVNRFPYNRFDSLASENDLTLLFEVLFSVKDKNGNSPIITANTIVTNPDFEKIQGSDFREYFYEPFTETLSKYPEHSNSFHLWKQGIQLGIFRPQFHGREHININKWMRALRKSSGYIRLAFDYRMYDLSLDGNISEDTFVDALNFEIENEIDFQRKSIKEGLKLFAELFGYKSTTFIAPCNIWSRKLNETLFAGGITGLKGGWYQFEPRRSKLRKIFHYTGQKNNLSQYHLIRNASFEPSQIPNFNFVEDILSRMNIAFNCGKPLIIGTHRLNYIGYIDPANRDKNLKILSQLLKEIVKRYPDVEFMSSDQLIDIIQED